MRQLLNGNEAIALAAFDGGVRVGSGYPGTPSTEILESLGKQPDVCVEWAPNEKVGLDVGIGAAYSGARAIVTMKHVGLNVAADSLFYSSYTGVIGGLVIVVADDPGMFSSQNEQDSRNYAKFAKLPMLEPSDSQEAYDLTIQALEISERFACPALLRITTRIAHSKTLVERTAEGCGRPELLPSLKQVVSDARRFVMVPANARTRHPVVEERLGQLSAFAAGFVGNRVEEGNGELGIVTSGVAYQYAREAFPTASFFKLGMSYPLPLDRIAEFSQGVDRLLVIEELDPFFEEQIRLAGVKAEGKSFLPVVGELSVDVIRDGAEKVGLLKERDRTGYSEEEMALPARPPALCPGCGHRGLFYVLKKLKLSVLGDIGCYSLAVAPPLASLHTLGCMGASIGQLHGALRAGVEEKSVAVIGDSTFFHTGMPALLNAVYNGGPSVTIILDNGTTAMTGHQGNPGNGRTLQGPPAGPVDLPGLVRSMGIQHIATVDPYDLAATEAAVGEALAAQAPAVVIAKRTCVLVDRTRLVTLAVDANKCNLCGLCRGLGCPALIRGEDSMYIDQQLCTGCGLCAQVCARKAVVKI